MVQKTKNLRTPEEAPYSCPKCGISSDNPISVCDGSHDDEGCNILISPTRPFRRLIERYERLRNVWETADDLNREDPHGVDAYWPEFEEALQDIVGADTPEFEVAAYELRKILFRSPWKTRVLTTDW